MSPDDAFLRAILESPDDDTPRLIYADWPEDRGRPERAEFIRVQCALARLPEDDARLPGLEARERELLEEHEEEWAGPLRPWLVRWAFSRGFVESITMPAQVYLDRGPELARLAP